MSLGRILSRITFLIKDALSYFSSFRFLILFREIASIRDILSACLSAPSTNTTYSAFAAELAGEGERVVRKEDVPYLLSCLKERFFPVQSPVSLSLADMVLAARDFLLGKSEHICGDVYGTLAKPYEIEKSLVVTKDDMIRSCDQIKDGEFLPERILVGDEYIGTADWLYAALEILCGSDSANVEPKDQLPCLDCMPKVRDSSLKGTWQHSDSFEDNYLSDRLRYQSYTMRFRTNSRKI